MHFIISLISFFLSSATCGISPLLWVTCELQGCTDLELQLHSWVLFVLGHAVMKVSVDCRRKWCFSLVDKE
jgi:hypothetical protein